MRTTQIELDDSIVKIPVHQDHPIMKSQILANYEKVLSYSNLPLHSKISYRNVLIFQNQYIHQIFTKSDTELPHLVFLHGFGGTSMTALRLFQHLDPHFQIHALDSFGFGFSSRGNFSNQFNFEQTVDYYIQAVEQWRKALKIQKFFLMGHSFGGYLASWYAVKYPERVIHLFLASPAGASQSRFGGNNGEVTCRQKIFLSLGKTIYNCNIRPSRAMTNFLIGKRMVNSILINRLKIPDHEQEDWREYFYNVNSQNDSSQIGFYKLFEWPLRPKVTIEEMIREKMIKCSVSFYFGDQDWMPRDGAQRLVKDKIKNVSITTVPNSGHQIVFDNSKFLCDRVEEKYRELKGK